jgi:RNA polymerase sigma-70 factor (ECF subfamily)
MNVAEPTSSPPPSLTVPALVVRAQKGDRSAEGLLCQRFSPAVSAFARRRLRTTEAVREFEQDVLLLFVEALRRGAVSDPERVGGFILGICRNVALDRARQRERRQALWLEYGAVLTDAVTQPPEHPTYETIHLEDCLTQLSQRARDVIRWSYVDAKSHREIASELATSESNARILRHRTLHALRECLSKRISWEAA